MANTLKDTEQGEVVLIVGVKAKDEGTGKVSVWFPGVGETGCWSMPGSVVTEESLPAAFDEHALLQQAFITMTEIVKAK